MLQFSNNNNNNNNILLLNCLWYKFAYIHSVAREFGEQYYIIIMITVYYY